MKIGLALARRSKAGDAVIVPRGQAIEEREEHFLIQPLRKTGCPGRKGVMWIVQLLLRHPVAGVDEQDFPVLTDFRKFLRQLLVHAGRIKIPKEGSFWHHDQNDR